MRILLLGATGFIGNTIFTTLTKKGYELYGTYHRRQPDADLLPYFFPFDLQTPENINSILDSVHPEFIISSINGDFSCQLRLHEILAEYVKASESRRLIFISTANVFDNSLNDPHIESDTPDAESSYGLYKAECEHLLLSRLGSQAVILRIPSVWGKNCPRIKQLNAYKQQGKVLQMWDNLMMNYTTPTQIADWISYIIENRLTGIFHVGTKDMMKYWDFYQEIMNRLHLPAPDIAMEHLDKTYYQAVLPTRADIPENLQMCVEDVIAACKN